MAAGAESLKAKLQHYRPKIVCFNGMGIYTAFSGKKTVTLGLQDETLDGMLLFVVPSSSGRTAAYQRDVKLRCYRELKALVDKVGAGPVEATS
jgi:TDG/mug DNA glycosylase family protein